MCQCIDDAMQHNPTPGTRGAWKKERECQTDRQTDRGKEETGRGRDTTERVKKEEGSVKRERRDNMGE